MTTSSVLMKEVRSHIGEGGSVFQKWAGIPGQPWCDAFVSYNENKTDNGDLYCDGAKEINCPHSMNWCIEHLASIPIYLAMEGDVSFFDWQPNGLPDHVGFVDERKNADFYYTIEGNTSGGIVARRERSDEEEQLTFRLHYTPTPFSADKPLEVDGIYGYSSIAVTQKWLGVPIDAILGQGTVKALQRKLGVTADGLWGVKTTKALQKLVGVTQDGLMGPATVKAFQTYLNEHAHAKPEPTPSADKYKVIDVSEWQGNIDWANVKADGVVGAIIRYADGDHLDPYFDRNMSEAKANGLHIGAYIFSRSKTKIGGENEAVRLYNASKPYAPDLPLYIDLEDAKLKSYANIVAQAFLRKMVALGGKGGVYANLNWWNNYLAETARDYSSNAFWIAQYYDKVTHKNPSLFGMWQYSSSGKVKGINGKVDMDWLYNAYWETAPKPTPTPKPTPQPTVNTYQGKLPSLRVKKTAEQVIADTLKWGKWIAGYNLFHYGHGDDSHHNGCYFCGTQPKNKEKSGIKDWEYTYCCNPLVHACFAHGGQVVAMLSLCQRGSSYDFHKGRGYDKSSLFKNLGKPSKESLQKGDVLCKDTHVALYIGDGKIVQAGHEDDNKKNSKSWNTSIEVTTLTDAMYKNYKRVHRFIGSVDSDIVIRIGEYSDRVKEVQSFLNWYFGKTVCTVDGMFGDTTLKYVKAFQTAMGITADGIVGNDTIAKMKSARR